VQTHAILHGRIYSSDRRRPSGFVTLTPNTLALQERKTCEIDLHEAKISPIENSSTVSAAHIVRDLSSEGLVVHEENIDFAGVFHEEFLESAREKMSSLEKKKLYWSVARGTQCIQTFLLLP